VTAFVVLQFPDHIEYRFTSNQRETRDFILGQKFITNILQTLGSAKKDELSDMTSHILRASLSFTRPRLEAYVDNLKKQAVPCIRACIMEDTDQCKYTTKPAMFETHSIPSEIHNRETQRVARTAILLR
jgi:hypothetical protein